MSSLLQRDSPSPLTKPLATNHGALPFNKMFIMIPVMLAARNLKNDDINTVYRIRMAYIIVQSICLLLVVYTYIIISSLSSSATTNMNRIIYVPAPPQPFADPNTSKKKYTEIKLGTHLLSQSRSLLGSTLFGIVMTCGLHYYKGMIMGLAIQAIMGPFNIWENILVRTILLRGTKVFTQQTDDTGALRIFDEKISLQELDAATDEAIDEHGNPIVLRSTTSNAIASSNGTSTLTTAATITTTSKSLEDVMLDTWDQGANASLVELLSMLNTSNINTSTKDDGWTSLMIVSGLKCNKDIDAIQTMIQEYNADIMQVDHDGWTCLHWAAFHNSITAATELYQYSTLFNVTDKEGKTPLDIAITENNTDIIDLLQTVNNDTKKDK